MYEKGVYTYPYLKASIATDCQSSRYKQVSFLACLNYYVSFQSYRHKLVLNLKICDFGVLLLPPQICVEVNEIIKQTFLRCQHYLQYAFWSDVVHHMTDVRRRSDSEAGRQTAAGQSLCRHWINCYALMSSWHRTIIFCRDFALIDKELFCALSCVTMVMN